LIISLVIKELGFVLFSLDLCLFKYEKLDILLILYVDDLLVSVLRLEVIIELRNDLNKYYSIKDLRKAKRFLSFDIIRDRSVKIIFLSQEAYIIIIIKKFGYNQLIEAKTP